MRVSLLLVAFAICRFASSEVIFWAYIDTYRETNITGKASPFSIAPEGLKEQFGKFVPATLPNDQLYELLLIMGNTLYAMTLDGLGKYDSLPSYYKNALDNGVLCEIHSELEEGTIRSMLYPGGELSAEEREWEEAAARDPVIGIDCTSPSPDPCFCTEKKVLLYCAAVKHKSKIERAGVVAKSMCEKELIERYLKRFDTSNIFANIYFDDHHNGNFAKTISDTEVRAYSEVASRYCSATDPAAETIAKTFFAANALRWTLESYVMEAAFGGEHNDIDSACAMESFKESEVGQCACTKDKGLSFCVYKAHGDHLKKHGYLVCEGAVKGFTASPAPLPPFACLSDSVAAATAVECAQWR